MGTIIDRYGRLHIDTASGYHIYNGAPSLIFSPVIDSKFAITQEGELYSTEMISVVDTGDIRFVDVISSQFTDEDGLTTEAYALTDYGALIFYALPGSMRGEVIAEGVRLFSYYDGNISYITEDGVWVSSLLSDDEVTEVDISRDIINNVNRMSTGLLITDSHVIMAHSTGYLAYEIEGKLIDVRLSDAMVEDKDILILLECIEGKLRIAIREVENMEGKVEPREVFHNTFVECMNCNSIFTQLVEYYNKTHILNGRGILVELLINGRIRGPRIHPTTLSITA